MSKNLSKFELVVSRFRQIGNDSTHIGYNFGGTKAMILSKKIHCWGKNEQILLIHFKTC